MDGMVVFESVPEGVEVQDEDMGEAGDSNDSQHSVSTLAATVEQVQPTPQEAGTEAQQCSVDAKLTHAGVESASIDADFEHAFLPIDPFGIM